MQDTSLPIPERLTVESASSALVNLRTSLSSASSSVVSLDASGMKDFDTSAVAVLLELRREMLAHGKDIQIRNWPDRLTALVRLYGVDELLVASA